jgi:murein DD-endopeptidase MepM/ murein hydrolase activator NlpD
MIYLKDIFIGDYRISQKWGGNYQMYKKYGLKGHNGVDWALPTGTILISPFDGIVISAKKDKDGYGTHIKIWDPKQKCCVIFAHMKSVNVKVWQRIKVGQLIGFSDNTGFSTGPHLHFGICRVNSLCYRLNKTDGFGGWFNCLDKKQVTWCLSNPTKPLI